MLVWYETYGDVNQAIAREKQLKKWERKWKLALIEQFNPEWRDLYETLNA
jgi:putative endonuclease